MSYRARRRRIVRRARIRAAVALAEAAVLMMRGLAVLIPASMVAAIGAVLALLLTGGP